MFTCCCVWTRDSRYLIMMVLKSFTLSFCGIKKTKCLLLIIYETKRLLHLHSAFYILITGHHLFVFLLFISSLWSHLKPADFFADGFGDLLKVSFSLLDLHLQLKHRDEQNNTNHNVHFMFYHFTGVRATFKGL